jgi:hypothetical protein
MSDQQSATLGKLPGRRRRDIAEPVAPVERSAVGIAKYMIIRRRIDPVGKPEEFGYPRSQTRRPISGRDAFLFDGVSDKSYCPNLPHP